MKSRKSLIFGRSFSAAGVGGWDRPFVEVWAGLRHSVGETQLEVVAAQRVLSVVLDQGNQAGKVQVGRQEIVGASLLGADANATVLHPPAAPRRREGGGESRWRRQLLKYSQCRTPSTLPEGQGVAEGASVARSDQEGAVLSPRLGAVLVDQPLGHLPSLSHLTVKPQLRTVQVLVLDGHGGHRQNIHTHSTHTRGVYLTNSSVNLSFFTTMWFFF